MYKVETRYQLQKCIQEAVETFQRNTGVCVSRIDMSWLIQSSGPGDQPMSSMEHEDDRVVLLNMNFKMK